MKLISTGTVQSFQLQIRKQVSYTCSFSFDIEFNYFLVGFHGRHRSYFPLLLSFSLKHSMKIQANYFTISKNLLCIFICRLWPDKCEQRWTFKKIVR